MNRMIDEYLDSKITERMILTIKNRALIDVALEDIGEEEVGICRYPKEIVVFYKSYFICSFEEKYNKWIPPASFFRDTILFKFKQLLRWIKEGKVKIIKSECYEEKQYYF